MAAFGTVTQKHVLKVAKEFDLKVVDTQLGALQYHFELVGALSGQPVHASIPSLPKKNSEVEIRMPMEHPLDLEGVGVPLRAARRLRGFAALFFLDPPHTRQGPGGRVVWCG